VLFRSDLLLTDTTLGLLLVTMPLRGPWEEMAWPELRLRLGCRRRDLLPLLGLPPEERVVKLLRRTDPDAVEGAGADVITRAFTVEDRKLRTALSHVQLLTSDHLRLLADPMTLPAATPALLLSSRAEARNLHLDLARLQRLRARGLVSRMPKRFTCHEEIRSLLRPHLDEDPWDEWCNVACALPGD
jgi:hypothetical protein